MLGSLLITALTAAPVGLVLVIASALVFASIGLRPLRRVQEAATLISANNLTALPTLQLAELHITQYEEARGV